jgi:hypothetical protein
VLAFHGVDDPEVFETLMDRVRRQYHPISVDELDRAINSGIDLPDRSVLITFDDGHRSVLEHGLPILVAREIERGDELGRRRDPGRPPVGANLCHALFVGNSG